MKPWYAAAFLIGMGIAAYQKQTDLVLANGFALIFVRLGGWK